MGIGMAVKRRNMRRRCSGRVLGMMLDRRRFGSGDDELVYCDVLYEVKGVGYRHTFQASIPYSKRGMKFKVRYDPDDPACSYVEGEEDDLFRPVVFIAIGLAAIGAFLYAEFRF